LKRTYKFTCDSLLSVDGDTIKKEIPFLSIAKVMLENIDLSNVVSIEYKDGKSIKLKCLESIQTENFYHILNMVVNKYSEEHVSITDDIYSSFRSF